MVFKEGKTLEIKISKVKETDNGIIKICHGKVMDFYL